MRDNTSDDETREAGLPPAPQRAEARTCGPVPGASPPGVQPPAGRSDELDGIARRTLALDLVASLLLGATEAVLQMGPALAKKGFDASDYEVAYLTCGQSLGLVLSFFVAHWSTRHSLRALVFWPEALRSAALGLVAFLDRSRAMGFVVLHAIAQLFQSMTVPARVTIYQQSYPDHLRGKIVGQNRRVQFCIAALASIAMAAVLDGKINLAWSSWQGESGASLHPGAAVTIVVPLIGAAGLLGSLVFALAPLRGQTGAAERVRMSDTLRSFVAVWREDRGFRRYQLFFFIFGFANIMTIPLVQIHAVDVLGASYFELAMINVAVTQLLMAATMGSWGKLLDRRSPSRLRGYINIIFSLDFLFLAIAPTIGWVYVGRVFRGVALGGGQLIWMLGSLYYARSAPEKAPIYLGVHTVLTGLRWALAPLAGVALKNAFATSARPIFFLVFAVVLGTALLMVRRSQDEPPPGAEIPPPMPAPRTTGA